MGNPVSRTYAVATTVVGPQLPVNLEWNALAHFTLGVFIVSGTAAYSVEGTLDDINDPSVTPRWFTLNEFPVSTAVTKYAAFQNPWLFVRLNVEAITGLVEMKVQGSTINAF